MTVDPRAASGFGSRAEEYERARPAYAGEAIERLARELHLGSTSTVLDLAAGTGKLSRMLVPLVGRVIAVEPSPAMRAELRRQLPAIDVREGVAEAIPLGDGSLDAVLVGQAFHWFQPAEALDEIARVLRPGGGLAMLWNRARWDELPWAEPFHALVEPHREAAGEFPAGEQDWRAALTQSPQFSPRQEARYTHVHRTDVEEFLVLVASWSWIANLPDAERARVLQDVRGLLDATSVLELRYETEVYWTHRIA